MQQCSECAWNVNSSKGWYYTWKVNKSSPNQPPYTSQPQLGEVLVPSIGMRSSPALGGIGAGSFELRADGSFREWTIMNQGPGGSGAFIFIIRGYLCVRVCASYAYLLRKVWDR